MLEITDRKTISASWRFNHQLIAESIVYSHLFIRRIEVLVSTDYLFDSRATSSTITTNSVNSTIYSGLDNGSIIALQLSGEGMKYSSISFNHSHSISSIGIDPSSSCVGNYSLLLNSSFLYRILMAW